MVSNPLTFPFLDLFLPWVSKCSGLFPVAWSISLTLSPGAPLSLVCNVLADWLWIMFLADSSHYLLLPPHTHRDVRLQPQTNTPTLFTLHRITQHQNGNYSQLWIDQEIYCEYFLDKNIEYWVVKIQIANIVPNWLLQRQAEFLFSIFNQESIITPLLSRGRGTCLKLSETCSVAAEARRNLCPGREECRSLLYAERMRLQQSPGNSGPPWPCRELQSSPGYWRNKISLHWPKCRIE